MSTSIPPLDDNLLGAFSGDRLGAPDASYPLETVLSDHLFAAAPDRSSEESSTSPVAPAPASTSTRGPITFRSAVDPALGGAPWSTRDARREPAKGTSADLPPVGSIIEKYRLEQLLGTGGFGAVYRATHLLLQKTVAIKLLRSHGRRGRADLAAGLHDEARFAARISHPNVVQVYDVTHTPEITYVVMEYVDGVTLGRTIQRHGPISGPRVVDVAIDVTRGLQAALDQGLIHRDIKPQNIILTPAGTAKILDLGLARSSVDKAPSTLVEAPRASVVGTSGYMAPEQLTDPEHVDFRADIYSLGVTLYEAATGVPPFPTADPRVTADLHRFAPVPPPETVNPRIAQTMSRTLLWMLEKTATRRPSSYAVLEQALQNLKSSV